MKTLDSSPSVRPDFCELEEHVKKFHIPRQARRWLESAFGLFPFSLIKSYYAGLGSCMLYHRISSREFGADEISPYNSLTVTKHNFEEQIKYFKQNFNCLSLDRAVELLRCSKLPSRSIVVTFDDGYKDNFYNALPILEKYDVPATIYVTSGLVDRTADLWWFEQEFIVQSCSALEFQWEERQYAIPLSGKREKYQTIENFNKLFRILPPDRQKTFMAAIRQQAPRPYSYDHLMATWEELREFDRHPLVTIGAHTVSHPMLSALSEESLYRELRDSKRRLEEELGHEVPHLAYPFGADGEVGEREFQAASNCGYQSAVTTRNGHIHQEHSDYLHMLPRISANYDDTITALKWKLSGLFAMITQRGRKLAAI